MKKLILITLLFVPLIAGAQDFDKNLASARTAYGAGKL